MLQLIDMHGSCEYFHILHRLPFCIFGTNAVCHCCATFGHDELDLLQYFSWMANRCGERTMFSRKFISRNAWNLNIISTPQSRRPTTVFHARRRRPHIASHIICTSFALFTDSYGCLCAHLLRLYWLLLMGLTSYSISQGEMKKRDARSRFN